MTPRGTGARGTPKPIETRAATVRLREDGIINIVFASGTEMDLDCAEAVTAAVQALTDRPRPVLADPRALRSADILAMRHAAGPKAAKFGSRLAILVGSPVSRMLGSVFLGLAKPPYPTRLFTDEQDAVTWLLASSAEDATGRDDATRDRGEDRAGDDRARVGNGPAA